MFQRFQRSTRRRNIGLRLVRLVAAFAVVMGLIGALSTPASSQERQLNTDEQPVERAPQTPRPADTRGPDPGNEPTIGPGVISPSVDENGEWAGPNEALWFAQIGSDVADWECGAVQLSASHLLTAAHCIVGVAESDGAPLDSSDGVFLVGNDLLYPWVGGLITNDGLSGYISGIEPHPQADAAVDVDLAMLTIEWTEEDPNEIYPTLGARTAQPATPNAPGTPWRTYGRGRQFGVPMGGALKWAGSGPVPDFLPDPVWTVDCTGLSDANPNLFCGQHSDAGRVCKGDSGGPTVEDGIVIGIASEQRPGSLICGQAEYVLSVDVWMHRCWIDAQSDGQVRWKLPDGSEQNGLPEDECTTASSDGNGPTCTTAYVEAASISNDAAVALANGTIAEIVGAYNDEFEAWMETVGYAEWFENWNEVYEQTLDEVMQIPYMDHEEVAATQANAQFPPPQGQPEPPDLSDPSLSPDLADLSDCLDEMYAVMSQYLTGACGSAFLNFYFYYYLPNLPDSDLSEFNAYCMGGMGLSPIMESFLDNGFSWASNPCDYGLCGGWAPGGWGTGPGGGLGMPGQTQWQVWGSFNLYVGSYHWNLAGGCWSWSAGTQPSGTPYAPPGGTLPYSGSYGGLC